MQTELFHQCMSAERVDAMQKTINKCFDLWLKLKPSDDEYQRLLINKIRGWKRKQGVVHLKKKGVSAEKGKSP